MRGCRERRAVAALEADPVGDGGVPDADEGKKTEEEGPGGG